MEREIDELNNHERHEFQLNQIQLPQPVLRQLQMLLPIQKFHFQLGLEEWDISHRMKLHLVQRTPSHLHQVQPWDDRSMAASKNLFDRHEPIEFQFWYPFDAKI